MSNDFDKSIEKAGEILVKQLIDNAETAAIFLVGEAQRHITRMKAVEEGILRASMQYKIALKADRIIAVVGNSSEYAPYVHQGTGIYALAGDGRKTPWRYEDKKGEVHWTQGQKPRPFLEKAQNDNLKSINKLLGGR
ncbi:HK97 gp10 family phage protein [Listeria monocytogenes]|uniref:HK97 gp10 family phage protein n=1 Tax=Listeria monocytogenes TaxID=1639 RepID=UPI0007757DD8|nr:HK97 gp10 family phage protein [Listeria monocytogenes]EAF5877621.1 HK97 gp10 family phage protein [Listeria monocytogenes]KXS65753.1 hypothetical protein AWJ02_01480 [Listeria monocytogenes]KXW92908.1 hypothetical protein AWJ00_08235 [Listeria monocytogenes]